MAKQIEIQIPRPCPEDWNNMLSKDKGRFCNSCQKTIIDFSSMTNEQLVNFFKRKEEHVCGRFSNGQLNRQIEIPAKRIPWLTYFFKISIPLFLVSIRSTAQEMLNRNNIVIVIPEKKSIEPIITPNAVRIIDGNVKGPDGKNIPYATIMVTGTTNGTGADSSGHFSLKVRGENSFIDVSALGYDKVRIPISAGDRSITVTLQKIYETMTMGVVVTGYSKKKMIKKNKIANPLPVFPVEANTIIIYPNPISTYSTLTLKWKYPVSEKQLVEIFNMDGELIQKENIIVSRSSSTALVQLAVKNSGNYVVRTIDSKTNKILTTQLLVQ